MSRLTPKERDEGWKNKVPLGDALDKLAHYEDLEEAGRLITLPCKPCERVWVANGCHEPWQTVCSRIHQIVNIMEIGWAIGYTKAEAERKLAEMERANE